MRAKAAKRFKTTSEIYKSQAHPHKWRVAEPPTNGVFSRKISLRAYSPKRWMKLQPPVFRLQRLRPAPIQIHDRKRWPYRADG